MYFRQVKISNKMTVTVLYYIMGPMVLLDLDKYTKSPVGLHKLRK